MNFIEKWVLKRLAKKLIKKLPDLAIKKEEVEQHIHELFDTIELAIVKFVERYEK